MFYFGRAYQGAEGRVYPYPLQDKLTGVRQDRTYNLVYLENEYIKVGVMPEIGGRIFSAVDKTNGYDFFYRQHVIKPALIGMLGAWISGGVEWNIPHHHRPSSFLPVQHAVEEAADGAKTVWVGELEIRHRMRWAVGLTLHPGRSYLEATIRIMNRTPVVNTALAWANVAVHIDENYQVIFPPRTQFGTHHSKRQFVRWPVADSTYGGTDFSKGVDVSWFRNHQFGNSIFAWNYDDDFLAGYDHGKNAGTMAVSNHHMVPGKKLWTWGNGPGGRLWDKVLSDTDGPYIELMVGALSDNQPDYSWVQPYETKDVQIFWYPFRDTGGVKNANVDAAVNLDVSDGNARMAFYTTSARSSATVQLEVGDKVAYTEQIAIAPNKPYRKTVDLPAGVDPTSVRAALLVDGRELVGYAPLKLTREPLPKPVDPPSPPKDVRTVEELYTAGLRIDAFHNPALEPETYWEEALRRDPGDSRVNTAMAIRALRQARYADAERHLRTAIERLTAGYTSPKDGEPFYYLGLALKAQDKMDAAFTAFYKAVWSAAWQAPAYFSLAEIASLRGETVEALALVDRALRTNTFNTRALNLKAALLRQLGRKDDARRAVAQVLAIDPLDVRALTEQSLLSGNLQQVSTTFHQHPATALETAVELASAGMWTDASTILQNARPSALGYYYLADFARQQKQDTKAREYYAKASKASPDYEFPFQAEAVSVLRRAMAANPSDARAPYYLGNLLFDWQPREAIALWEKSRALDPEFAIVQRNLGMAYARVENAAGKAIASLEKAVAAPRKHAIHFFELDALYEAAGIAPEKRLAMLEQNHSVVAERDDALAREIQLKVFAGKYDEAIRLMTNRRFNVWEGGARFSVHDSWTDAHLLRGHQHFAAKRFKDALADYERALEFPEGLQTARHRTGGRFPEVAWWTGLAMEALGQQERATKLWAEVAETRIGSGNDDILATADSTVLRFYRALAQGRLGHKGAATEVFTRLVKSGASALKKAETSDFFAKFGEGQTPKQREAQAHFISALGYTGLGDTAEATRELQAALAARPDHVGAQDLLRRTVK